MKFRSSASAAVVLAGLFACNLALAAGDADSSGVSQKPVVKAELVGASDHGFNVFDVSSTTSASLAGLDVRTKVGYDEAVKRVTAARARAELFRFCFRCDSPRRSGGTCGGKGDLRLSAA